MMLPIL